jgi:hypothetical protein
MGKRGIGRDDFLIVCLMVLIATPWPLYFLGLVDCRHVSYTDTQEGYVVVNVLGCRAEYPRVESGSVGRADPRTEPQQSWRPSRPSSVFSALFWWAYAWFVIFEGKKPTRTLII